MNKMKIVLIIAVSCLVLITCGKPSPELECTKPIDLVFVVDSSRSMTRQEFHTQMEFVRNLTHSFKVNPSHTRVSVVQFAHYVKNLFCLNEYTSNDALDKGIQDKTRYIKGSTYTSKALKYVRDHIIYNKTCGARNSVEKIVILITDGRANFPDKANSEATLLKNKGVKLLTIGIGEEINKDELDKMASSPEVSFTDIKFVNLDSIKPQVSKKACDQPESQTECKDDRNTPCKLIKRFGRCPQMKVKCAKMCGFCTVIDSFTTTKKPTTTTEEPTTSNKETTTIANPTTEVRTHDVVFLLDTSYSINQDEYTKMVDYVEKITLKFNVSPGGTRVGLVHFNQRAYPMFDFNKYTTNHELAKGLEEVKEHWGDIYKGSTRASNVLKYLHKYFDSKHGARPGNVDVAVLVWDGKTDFRTTTIKKANELKARGVYLVSVGVGNYHNSELSKIIASPGMDFHVADYDHLTDLISNFDAANIEHAEEVVREQLKRNSQL